MADDPKTASRDVQGRNWTSSSCKHTRYISLLKSNTVEPRFNEPLFNEVLDITKDILCPGQSYSKMYGIEPRYNEPRYNEFLFDITNIIQKPKRKTYLDITNYNVKTRQKINVNCCWFLFSSMYHFLLKFCYALNANCVLRN